MYNKIVEALKVIARDSLRMEIVVDLQSKVANVQNLINENAKHVEEVNKEKARIEFRKSQVHNENPDRNDILSRLEKETEYLDQELESLNKSKEELLKSKADKEADIAKVEAGEVKVSLEKLNNLTDELIKEITKDTAVTKAKELMNS